MFGTQNRKRDLTEKPNFIYKERIYDLLEVIFLLGADGLIQPNLRGIVKDNLNGTQAIAKQNDV